MCNSSLWSKEGTMSMCTQIAPPTPIHCNWGNLIADWLGSWTQVIHVEGSPEPYHIIKELTGNACEVRTHCKLHICRILFSRKPHPLGPALMQHKLLAISWIIKQIPTSSCKSSDTFWQPVTFNPHKIHHCLFNGLRVGACSCMNFYVPFKSNSY